MRPIKEEFWLLLSSYAGAVGAARIVVSEACSPSDCLNPLGVNGV